MQGFFKQEMNNIKQILFCTDPQVSVGIIVDDTGVDAGDDGRKIVPAGTPMYGSLLDRATPFTVSGSDTDPSASAAITAGTGITAVSVTAATFDTAVHSVGGQYNFTYFVSGSEGAWYLGTPTLGNTVDLTDYGIEVTGTPENQDTFMVEFTAGTTATAVGVLLHDVDVTAGDNNGTLLIFGFVNINRLDEATASALLAAESDLDGKVFVCAG